MRSPILASILMPALVLAGCTASEADTQPPSATSSATTGIATAILNAGVTAEIGTAQAPVRLLFDPLYDDHFGSLEQLDDALIERIVTGEAPYDGVTAVFVSHAHGDHLSARHLNRLLAAQSEVMLVAPGQAIAQLRADDGWEARFEERMRAITLDNGEASEAFAIAGATIEAFRTPHSGWPDRHTQVHNITFRVSMPAGEGVFARVMHLGDADPGAEHYAALEDFLQRHRTSLAMVPYWHYREAGFADLLEDTFNAEAAVAMHVPIAKPSYLREIGRPFFTKAGEMVEITAVR